MEPGAWELPELYDVLAESLWLLIGLPSDGSGVTHGPCEALGWESLLTMAIQPFPQAP